MRHLFFKLSCVAFITSQLVMGCTATPGKQPQPAITATAVPPADEVLHQRLQAVLDADNTFTQLSAKAVPTATLDSQNETITAAEIALKNTIDSLEQTGRKNSDSAGLLHTLAYFKVILQNRGALSDLRMVLSANSDDSTTMQQRLLQLRTQTREKEKEVQDKIKKIHDLERTLGHMSTLGTVAENGAAGKLGNYTEAKGESMAELKQRNKNLYLAYSSLQNKYFIVGRNFLLLKQEHDRTLNELAALRKASGQK